MTGFLFDAPTVTPPERWCPWCGDRLADSASGLSCSRCGISWSDDGENERAMVATSGVGLHRMYRSPISRPFPLVPRFSDAELRRAAELAHPLFVANNWRWGLRRTDRGLVADHIPTIEEIVETLRLLQTPPFEGDDRVDRSSGRFLARASSTTNAVEIYLLLNEWPQDFTTTAEEVRG